MRHSRSHVGEGGLVDDAAPGGVDEPQRRLGVAQQLGVDEPDGLGRLGEVDGEEVGLADELVEGGHEGDAELAGPVDAHVRVVGEEAHPEGGCPLRDEDADPAEPDDRQRLVVQLDALPPGAVPRPRLEVGVGLGDVAGLRQQQGDGVLGGRQDVRLGGVHDHDAPAGGGVDVDVVEADAGSSDHDQVAAGLEDVLVDLGGASDHEGGDPGHGVEQVAGCEPEALLDLEAGGAHRVDPRARAPRSRARGPRQARVAATAGEPTVVPPPSTGSMEPPAGPPWAPPGRVSQRSSLVRRSRPSTSSSSASANDRHGVTWGTERFAGHERDPSLVEGELAQLDARGRGGPRDVAAEQVDEGREAVEGPFGWEAAHPRDRRQQLVHDATATLERPPHGGERVEVTGHRGQRGPLRDVRDVRGHVRLQVGGRRGDVGGRDDPTDPPAGHGVGLRDAVQHDAAVGELGTSAGMELKR